MNRICTDQHQNILHVFNEYGLQIMNKCVGAKRKWTVLSKK